QQVERTRPAQDRRFAFTAGRRSRSNQLSEKIRRPHQSQLTIERQTTAGQKGLDGAEQALARGATRDAQVVCQSLDDRMEGSPGIKGRAPPFERESLTGVC